jgi:two-component system CAI-1 autoinducer sensor kinase/phosphatase CqsS
MSDYPKHIHSDYLELISNNLSHELKTSLVAVKSGIKGVKNYLPMLVTAYEEATRHQLDVPEIQSRHIKMLTSALELAERAAHCASMYVSMFSMNISEVNPDKLFLETCSIIECVQLAIEQYPYRCDKQKALLTDIIKIQHDFLFSGNKLLMINLIINILKNAIYNIQNTGNGEIIIHTSIQNDTNHLFIQDTSRIIPPSELEIMFMPFNRLHRHDLGMGLFFCKQLMNALNGDITCHSYENKYNEFDMTFPPIDGR